MIGPWPGYPVELDKTDDPITPPLLVDEDCTAFAGFCCYYPAAVLAETTGASKLPSFWWLFKLELELTGKDDCFSEAESVVAPPATVLLTPPRLTKFPPPFERLLLPPALLPL